jgi:hypothetical protein
MSRAATFSATILETILGRLALLFLTGAAGDLNAAREAARQMLAAYHPETDDELRLAAEVIGFSFHALEALGQAMTPDMPLARVLRLRGSAVSLSRESHKAQRRLDQVQQARREGIPAEPPAPRPQPAIEKAVALIEDTRIVASAAEATGQTWTQAYEQRQRDKRIAASLQRAEARIAAQASAALNTQATQSSAMTG